MALKDKSKDVFRLNDCIIEMDGKIVGAAQTLSVDFSRNDEGLYQAGGGRFPYGFDQGNVEISGSIEVQWLDDEVFEGIDFETGKSPYLDIIGTSTNQTPKKKMKVVDAVINELSVSLEFSPSTVERSFNARKIVPK